MGKEVITKLMAETTKYNNVQEHAETLKTNNDALKKEINGLEIKLKSLEKVLPAEREKNSTLNAEVNSLKQQIQKLEGEKEGADQLVALQSETQELRSKMAEMKQSETTLKQQIATLEAMDTDKMKTELSELKQMLMKEKKIRNQVEQDRDNQKELIKLQEKQIRKLKTKSTTPLKRGQRAMSSSPSSSLSKLPAPKLSGKKRKHKDMKPIVLSDDSDDGVSSLNSQSSQRPRKRKKKSNSGMTGNREMSIDLTADPAPRSPRSPQKSPKSPKGKSKKHSAAEMNQMLNERLEKMKKSTSNSPKSEGPSLTRKWCSMNVNFSESNSLDPESVDSSFPSFDLHFVPMDVSKENVTKWTKPRQDILRVSQRMSVDEFRNEVSFAEWSSDQSQVPEDIGIFKCEHPATPNKTKTKPFIRVNKLLSEQDRIAVADCGPDYKLYFIPSSLPPSKELNRVYQPQMGTVQDRMWVIWKKQNTQKESKQSPQKKDSPKKANKATEDNASDPFAAFADGTGGFSSLLG